MYNNYFISQQRNQVNHFNYYYFTNAFNDSEMGQIKSFGESFPKIKATTVGSNDSEIVSEYRKSEISWIPENDDTKWLYSKIADYAMTANKEMGWNFDVWGYLDALQYTKYYEDGGHYDWHVDMGPGISNRKISVVLQLSDPTEYVGGDLEVNPGGNIMKVPKGKGVICFFPSFLLHRVTPVTAGSRTTLVTWLCGANFR